MIDQDLNQGFERVLEALSQNDKIGCITFSPAFWQINSVNMKNFLSLLRNSLKLNLKNVTADISHECLKNTELNYFYENQVEGRGFPDFNLTLKHNEMVFPNVIQYKKIMQESVVKYNKLTTNAAMLQVLEKSKVTPNEILAKSVKRASLDFSTNKKRHRYEIAKSTDFLIR